MDLVGLQEEGRKGSKVWSVGLNSGLGKFARGREGGREGVKVGVGGENGKLRKGCCFAGMVGSVMGGGGR